MKLTKLILENFRGYKNRTVINFNDITTFVGKNDSGKSTILEALDIFFNDGKGCIKIDGQDINAENKKKNCTDIVIGACFTNLPQSIVIDSSNKTSLEDEYLLNENEELQIEKIYSNGTGKVKVYIYAKHPKISESESLLQLKINDLKKKVRDLNIEDKVKDKKISAELRKAIWSYFKERGEFQLENQIIDVSKGESKEIWGQIEKYLPLYSLFQSDRSNNDSDAEVQDPLKHAVKEFLMESEVQKELQDVANNVIQKLRDVSKKTLQKLREMDPEVANTLKPCLPDPSKLKWADVFKSVSISGDEDIPINKRGSGIRRLILLNFFRVEAERRLKEQANDNSTASIIYAVEEPETSQHFKNQIILVKAFIALAQNPKVQIILTTHSGIIVKQLDFEDIRLVDKGAVTNIHKNCLPFVSLNEVNFIAFDEISEEYHDELYGYLEENGKLRKYEEEYIRKHGPMFYKKSYKGKAGDPKPTCLSTYIRHQIHHPENQFNERYKPEQLKNSIEAMRQFIQTDLVEN